MIFFAYELTPMLHSQSYFENVRIPGHCTGGNMDKYFQETSNTRLPWWFGLTSSRISLDAQAYNGRNCRLFFACLYPVDRPKTPAGILKRVLDLDSHCFNCQ